MKGKHKCHQFNENLCTHARQAFNQMFISYLTNRQYLLKYFRIKDKRSAE